MKSSEIETTQMQSTSAYWGYRELNADEVMSVAGGYDGDNGPSGGSAGGASQGNGADSNNPGGSAGSTEGMAAADCRANNALLTAQQVAAISGGAGGALGQGITGWTSWCYGDR